MTTDPLIRPEGVYVGATEGATRYQEDTVTDPAPAHTLDDNGDGKPDYSSEGWVNVDYLQPLAGAVVSL